MPIRGFDQYSQAPSSQKLPISVLNDTIIAIDGFWYLKKYMPAISEPALLNIQGILENTLQNLVNQSKSTQILWIWDGLDFVRSSPPREDTAVKAADATKKFEMNKPVKNLLDQEIFVDHVTRFLETNKISVIRAPYLAMAQCVYFLRENCVKYIFTKTDALFFKDGHKIITDINYESRCIEIVDRSELFKLNNFNLHGFQVLSFLSGCELLPTIPIYAFDFSLASIFDLIKNNNFEERLLSFYNSRTNSNLESIDDENFKKTEEGEYIKSFYRAFIITECHPVMTLGGRVEPLDSEDPASDLETVFGKRLPEVIYQDLFKCSIGPKLLNKVIINGQFQEIHKQKILNAFKGILEKKPSGREIFSSERIKQLFNMKIAWSSGLNKLVQILSVFLSGLDVDSKNMIRFINSGFKDPLEPANQSHPSIRFPELYTYMMMTEYIMIFSDLAKLIKIFSAAENDLAFNFEIQDLFREINEPGLKQFLMENINLNSDFTKYLEVLKK